MPSAGALSPGKSLIVIVICRHLQDQQDWRPGKTPSSTVERVCGTNGTTMETECDQCQVLWAEYGLAVRLSRPLHLDVYARGAVEAVLKRIEAHEAEEHSNKTRVGLKSEATA
jgi:hypothetical protein